MKGSHLKVSNSKNYRTNNNGNSKNGNGDRSNMFSQEDYSDINSPKGNKSNGYNFSPSQINKLAINNIGSHLATPGPMSG